MRELMSTTTVLRLVPCAMLIGFILLPRIAEAQTLKEQIVGTWRQVSVYNEEGGVKRHLYRSGYYISYLSKPDLPKFAANNRLQGSDAEYRAVMQGMVAGFGSYTVEGDTVTIKWIASSYPNRAGTTETRSYKVSGDELTAVNPTASGGGTSYAKFVRVK